MSHKSLQKTVPSPAVEGLDKKVQSWFSSLNLDTIPKPETNSVFSLKIIIR